MKIRALMNDGDGRFFAYEPSDLLRVGPTLTIDAPDVQTGLGKAYEIGNRMGADETGLTWPSDVRSLSVADVLVVSDGLKDHTDPSDIQAFTVDHVGFGPVDPTLVLNSLSFGTPSRHGLGSFRSDRP